MALVGCDAEHMASYAKKEYTRVVTEGKAYADSTEYYCYAWTDSTCSVANSIGDSVTIRWSRSERGVCPAVISGEARADLNALRRRNLLAE